MKIRFHHRGKPAAPAAGFTLLELAVVMVVIGLMIAIGARTVPWINEEADRDVTRKTMEEASQALIAFARTHHRLPCPDDDDDGDEDCGVATGSIPFRTLLLSDRVRDAAHGLIVYSVYRNANATLSLDADLARIVNRIDDFDNPPDMLNECDLCEALRNAIPAAASAGFTSTSNRLATSGGCAAGEVNNQAFVLASAGFEDRDGINDLPDEDNADATDTCFSSPLRGRDDGFDDIVTAVGFTRLAGEICP